MDAISQQVQRRSSLGQFDLNRTLEDFFKEILNLTFRYSLRNLNDKHHNAPGLDLGDPIKRVAYQITSNADLAKVKGTLEKISDEQLAAYDQIYILAIGEKQKSYKLDISVAARCRFREENVIGITDLCRAIMSVDLSTMQAIARKLADEQEQIRIELQPRIDNKYETTALDFIESFPDVGRSDASLLFCHPETQGLFSSQREAQEALDGFINELERLPRLTRELLGWLIDNSDRMLGIRSGDLQINEDLVRAKTRNMPSFEADRRLLEAFGFLDHEQDESWKSGHYRMHYPGAQRTSLDDAFPAFISAEGITAFSLFSTMDFSAFGPSPAPG